MIYILLHQDISQSDQIKRNKMPTQKSSSSSSQAMTSSSLVSDSKPVMPDRSSRYLALLAALRNIENFSEAKADKTGSLHAEQCEKDGVVGKN